MRNNTITNLTTVINVDDVIVVGIWSSLLSYGLIINILTILGICRSRTLRKLSSYWLILSVAWCDTMMIIISMAYFLPATLFHDSFVSIYDYRNSLGMYLVNVFWFSGVIQLAGMAINRYVSIVHPSYYRRLFTPCYTYMFLGFMYTVGIAVSLPTSFPCCCSIYDHHIWMVFYTNIDGGFHFVDIISNSLILSIMVLCYSAILWKVRKSRVSIRKHKAARNGDSFNKIPLVDQPSRREMKLLTQFVIVSVVFLLTFLTWQWLFFFPSKSKWIYFISTSLFFINNAINPTVYLIYNTALRKEVHDIFMNVCMKR